MLRDKFWWLAAPFLIMAAQACVEIFNTAEQKQVLLAEGGIHENFQALIMIVAFVLVVPVFRAVQERWLKTWMGVMLVGSLYVAGEELSWGQWLFNWETPEKWAAINDQNETNLHNVSHWLDQKMLILLKLGVLFGGIIIPLLLKFRPAALPMRFSSIYADMRILPVSLFCLALKLLDTYNDATGTLYLFWRLQEVLELYLYYFILVYILIMRERFLGKPAE
jgi:hypothetical protein